MTTDPISAEQMRILNMLQKTYGRQYWWHLVKMIFRKYFQKFRAAYFYWLKRLFDIFVSGILLVLLAPVFLLIILLVKADGGPAFFSQVRIGRRGKKFRFWKFRSMVPNADKMRAQLDEKNEMEGGVIFKLQNDPRITPIGKFLRKSSLDELPQLWNVFNGDMSLVGPRPPLPEEVERYNTKERQRLEAKQGITCIWQVSGRSIIRYFRPGPNGH